MKPEALGFDLYSLAEPKTHEDFMVLAQEARAEFAHLHGHMERILAEKRQASPAH